MLDSNTEVTYRRQSPILQQNEEFTLIKKQSPWPHLELQYLMIILINKQGSLSSTVVTKNLFSSLNAWV